MNRSIPTMPMPGGSQVFSGCIQIYDRNNMMGGFHHTNSSNELFEGRGSGTGSPSSLEPSLNGSNSNPNLPPGSAEDASKSFPLVLYAIVSDERSDNCIHWLPCGTRFVISEKEEFSTNILPRYFGGRGGSTTKFTSFTRRLKRWNFSRVPSGREMGAYFHEHFKRGERELAKQISYPVSKSQQASSKGGGGGGAGKEASGTGRDGATKAVPSIPKARRRASTGSILRGAPSSTAESELKLDDVDLLDISPTPIKAPIKPIDEGTIPPLPLLENDMKNWLSSADFMEDGAGPSFATPNETLSSIGTEPGPSVVSSSSSYMLPMPAAFPSNVVSGTFHQIDEAATSASVGDMNTMMKPLMTMMPRPGAMRRHSTTLENLRASAAAVAPPMCMPILTTSGSMGVRNSFASSLTCTPEMAVSATYNNMGFGTNNDDIMSPELHQNKLVPQSRLPQPPMTGSSAEENNMKDPFSFSRECSFDDLRMIDPFT